MTPMVWANVPLALLFILAFAGIPLWMTYRRPETARDHSHAWSYLAAKERVARRHPDRVHRGHAPHRRTSHQPASQAGRRPGGVTVEHGPARRSDIQS